MAQSKFIMASLKVNSLMTGVKDYLFIVLGILIYGIAFTAFILPHGIGDRRCVRSGHAGVFRHQRRYPGGSLTIWMQLDSACTCIQNRGAHFCVAHNIRRNSRLSFYRHIRVFFMGLGHPLIEDISMSAVLGAILCGVSVGIVFIHNGSTGGTDIVAAMVSKVSNVSIGRTMIFVDMIIVTSSLLLPYDGTLAERLNARVPLVVYGLVMTFIIAYMADMIINTNRQATQFIIFSHKWAEIADRINSEARRGVTVLDGEGWYSKQKVKVLMVWCRKIESVTIFRIVKSMDDNAFITQTKVNGVYGKGFDTMRVKMKK